MSEMNIDTSDMLSAFGTDIKVWSADKLAKTKTVGGLVITHELSENDAESWHEPIVPFSSSTSELANLVSGGTAVNADFLWYSNHLYPINSIVEVPSQSKRYRVMARANYVDYTDPITVIYQLKGDDQHDDGY